MYHGKFLFMDYKHRKLFVIKQNTFGGRASRWGSLCAPPDPVAYGGPISKGDGRDGREKRGTEGGGIAAKVRMSIIKTVHAVYNTIR